MSQKQNATRLLRTGFSLVDIAEQLGVSISTAIQYLYTQVGEGAIKRSDILFSIPQATRELFEQKFYKLRSTRLGDLYSAIIERGNYYDDMAQDTRHVPSQYPNIQAAIDAATNGDTVLVDNGVYQERVNFKGKLIKLISKNGPESTIIERDGGFFRGITFESRENSDVVIKGFSIRRFDQFGIYCEDSSPTIENNIIYNNSEAGIYCYNASPTIISNTIKAVNSQQPNGIVALLASNPRIYRNLIINHTEEGIQLVSASAQIANNSIVNNAASGIEVNGAIPAITNNIIVGSNTGIKNVSSPPGNPVFNYNDVWNNASNYFNCSPGSGSISASPLFVNPNVGDYHLQNTSPCIDAGDPASPLDPDGTRADMGAFYFHQVGAGAPAAPKNLQAKPGFNEVTLTWDANTEPEFLRYRIYSGTFPKPITPIDSIDGASNTTKTIKNLTVGTKYYFRITAIDNALKESGFSNEVSATPTDEIFTDISAPLPEVTEGAIAWADYDNDGDLDILLTGARSTPDNLVPITKIYRNDGGTFVDFAVPITPVWHGAVAWGDYDNDGDLDILLTGDTSTDANRSPVSLVYRNERGSFVNIGASLVGVMYSSAAWGDIDNDGDLDILLTGQNATGSVSKIYRNESGTFVDTSDSILIGVRFGSVAWGDYDNDSDLDVLLTGGIAKIYRNDGGSIVDVAAPLQVVGSSSVAWGDYNNDGILDILLAGAVNSTLFVSKIYRNFGGSFEDVSAPLLGIANGTVAWGDYDNDGNLDILITGRDINGNQSSKIYKNVNGNFVDIAAPLLGVAYGHSAAWGDYDSDGDLDILVTGDGFAAGYVTKIYRNNIGAINTVPTSPTNLASSVIGNTVTLSWNKSTDKETAQNGLTYNLHVGTTPGGSEIISPMANVNTGYRKIPQLGNTNHNTRWTIKNLPAGRYYWSVQAIDNAFAGSPFAGEQSFVIGGIDQTPPAAPQGLTAIAGDRQITLKWRRNTEADFLRYRIYRGTSPNPITKVDSTNSIADTSKTFAGLINGTRYYFRITAVDQNLNESGYSNEVSATPATANVPPAAPQNLAATAGDRQITLTWTANSEADFLRYRIYGGASPNPAAIVDSVQGSANTSKTLTGLSNGTTYFYRLTAVDQALNASGFSNEVSATPSATDLPPAPPQNLAATAGVAQITLTWNANTESDFLRYRIYGGTAANPTSKIDSVEGAANTSKTIANLTPGTTYYFRLTAVDRAMHASGFSNIATAAPVADKTAPVLGSAAYARTANLSSEVQVAISASDVSGLKNISVHYRAGGAASFSSKPMLLQSGSTYSQTIPAAAVTNRGVEFYVRAEDTYGNVAQTGLHPIRVYCPNGIANPAVQPSGKEASLYRLFSIPLELDNTAPATFLSAIPSLGAYDDAKYRWYGLERASQSLREYPNFGSMAMTPDMGFALLVNIRNVKLKTSSGTTVATTAPYNISLPAGWSLIGNPFNFNIPFDSLRVSFGAFELWSFEGDWQINTRGLEPWKGYAIWLSDAATFSIRPGVAGLNTGTALYSVANNAAENWLLQIIAENGRNTSRFNFAGQYAGATDNEDALDLHQPVRLADGVEVVFTKENSASLKADIRQPSSNGHTWEFTCRLNPEDEVLSLTFDGVATVPPAFDIFLLDPETATAYNLRANPRLQFATRHLTEKRFQLVAGTKAYLHEQSLQAELHPSSFELLQNFPNPFNPATQIIYSLPEASHVEVSVYNVRGERMATLVNERQESGSHTVVWNAERVGSGVYFIKMRAGRVEKMKKCVLVK